MSTSITISLDAFAKLLPKLGPELERATIRGLKGAALRLQGIVVEEIDTAMPHPAVDTGGLRNSVERRDFADGAEVYMGSPHAAIIEEGTRPFTPPLAPLIAWVIRKKLAGAGRFKQRAAGRARSRRVKDGGSTASELATIHVLEEREEAIIIARAIQKAIAKRGIRPRHYFQKAVNRLAREGWVEREINRELARLAQDPSMRAIVRQAQAYAKTQARAAVASQRAAEKAWKAGRTRGRRRRVRRRS